MNDIITRAPSPSSRAAATTAWSTCAEIPPPPSPPIIVTYNDTYLTIFEYNTSGAVAVVEDCVRDLFRSYTPPSPFRPCYLPPTPQPPTTPPPPPPPPSPIVRVFFGGGGLPGRGGGR